MELLELIDHVPFLYFTVTYVPPSAYIYYYLAAAAALEQAL